MFSELKITDSVYDMETDETSDITMTLSEVLLCLVGSEDLPLDLTNGLLEFDHIASGLPTFNTCGPSITFRCIDRLQDYKCFKESFYSALVGSRNYFGIS